MLYCNIRGFYNFSDLTKPSILYDLSKEHNIDILCLTETHLNSNICGWEKIGKGCNTIYE